MALSQEIVLYKNLGETPLQCLERFRLEHTEYKDEILSYAGRLDPMAEGLLLVIVGDANKAKEKYLTLDKEYEFQILWGIETDTYDILGKVVDTSLSPPSDLEIQEAMKQFVGEFYQEYPPYSSKTVNGKPLYEWAREGRLHEIEIPKKRVNIKSLKFITTRNIFSYEVQGDVLKRIKLVNGDFRQEEIKDTWIHETNNRKDFFVTSAVAFVSSGTYIRSLCHALGKKLGVHAIAYHIKRTRIGDYTI